LPHAGEHQQTLPSAFSSLDIVVIFFPLSLSLPPPPPRTIRCRYGMYAFQWTSPSQATSSVSPYRTTDRCSHRLPTSAPSKYTPNSSVHLYLSTTNSTNAREGVGSLRPQLSARTQGL
jgi:hypothetical protein